MFLTIVLLIFPQKKKNNCIINLNQKNYLFIFKKLFIIYYIISKVSKCQKKKKSSLDLIKDLRPSHLMELPFAQLKIMMYKNLYILMLLT